MSTVELHSNIYQDSKRFGFPTVIDGYFYPKSLNEIFAAKQQAHGTACWQDGTPPKYQAWHFMQGQPYTEENFIKRVKAEYPADFEEVLKLIPTVLKKKLNYRLRRWLQTGSLPTAPGNGLTFT